MRGIIKVFVIFLFFLGFSPCKSFSQTGYSRLDEPSNILFELLLYVSFYPIVGNYYMENHLYNNISDYPFQSIKKGNYIDSDVSKPKHFRIDIENHFLFSNEKDYGDHFKIKIRPFHFFYLQSDFFQIIGFNKNKNYPSFSVFNFSFCYDRLRFQRFDLGWTGGLNYVGNRIQKAGISGGFNMNWFVFQYLSINSSVKWGLISKKPVNNFETQIKFHPKNYFVSIGYETLKAIYVRYHFLSVGIGVYL